MVVAQLHKSGTLIRNDVRLEPHEEKTVKFLLEQGEDIELIVASYTKHNLNADFIMRQVTWKMKSPISSSTDSISRMFYSALRQSPNLIFDLRRLKTNQSTIKLLEKLFHQSRRVKKLWPINKNKTLLKYEKKR